MKKYQLWVLGCAAVIFAALVFSCTKQYNGQTGSGISSELKIAVFIPGVISGSPIYQMLADGVKRAASGSGQAAVTVIEAGFNQAEWESKLTALAAPQAGSGGKNKYDLIVSSNPSLPVIADSVSKKFPNARFLLLDGELSGNSSIYTLRYNQREQAYMAGYFAALLSAELGGSRLALVAAQHYPVMDDVILPGFHEGAAAAGAVPDIDFRIVGGWSDASKAMELAQAMIDGGAKVILTIAGGGNEGVLQAAAQKNARVRWFDTASYAAKPGIIAGCSILRQEEAAYDKTLLFLNGDLPFGSAETAGISDAYVDFADEDALYISTVSEAVREKQGEMLGRLRSGELKLPLDF
jgi:simple sugar transport system substrate-binding protein